MQLVPVGLHKVAQPHIGLKNWWRSRVRDGNKMTRDLKYDMSTIVGPFKESELRDFEQWLHGSGSTAIVFDEAYINHVRAFHGAVPLLRYFTTTMGTSHSITRFLNFLPTEANNAFSQYSVECTWSDIDDRLGIFLMPFAELFSGDYLCFDYQINGRPTVVVWFHDRSETNSPATEFVALNFDDFLLKLREEP